MLRFFFGNNLIIKIKSTAGLARMLGRVRSLTRENCKFLPAMADRFVRHAAKPTTGHVDLTCCWFPVNPQSTHHHCNFSHMAPPRKGLNCAIDTPEKGPPKLSLDARFATISALATSEITRDQSRTTWIQSQSH
mmetsp:Transcript_14205/g.28629  ORF Transcript_14205/g.28629 Transcript_14205/m.28629 type:complete len:134 (-) Transcript_14205:81-482(-)